MAEILNWCQQTVFSDQMGHPVYGALRYIPKYVATVYTSFPILPHFKIRIHRPSMFRLSLPIEIFLRADDDFPFPLPPLRQLRTQPRRRTFLPAPESAAERAAKVAMSEAGNGTGALFVLMDAIRHAGFYLQISLGVADFETNYVTHFELQILPQTMVLISSSIFWDKLWFKNALKLKLELKCYKNHT